MSAHVDTTTKLSYLLPTGTFLTFQVLAPLATNNGNCGVTEKALTGVTLGFLLAGCIATCFTDSYTAPDGKVYTGVITRQGLWAPTYQAESTDSGSPYINDPAFKPVPLDFLNAALSAIAFLTLTMFTDPVSTCFYPHLSGTILRTLPVLLAFIISFCSTFSSKIRHGYGNSIPRPTPTPETIPTTILQRRNSNITIKVDAVNR